MEWITSSSIGSSYWTARTRWNSEKVLGPRDTSIQKAHKPAAESQAGCADWQFVSPALCHHHLLTELKIAQQQPQQLQAEADNVAAMQVPFRSPPIRYGQVSTDVKRTTNSFSWTLLIDHRSPATDGVRLWMNSRWLIDPCIERSNIMGRIVSDFRLLHSMGSSVPQVESWRGRPIAWHDVRATWCMARRKGTATSADEM